MADTPTTLKTLDGFEIAPGEQAWAFGVAYAGGAVTLVGVTGSETSAHDGFVTWWGEWTDEQGRTWDLSGCRTVSVNSLEARTMRSLRDRVNAAHAESLIAQRAMNREG